MHLVRFHTLSINFFLQIFFSTDVQCVCASAQFQADATACLKQHCTSTDLSAALGLQSAECAGGTLSTPLPLPPLLPFFVCFVVIN